VQIQNRRYSPDERRRLKLFTINPEGDLWGFFFLSKLFALNQITTQKALSMLGTEKAHRQRGGKNGESH
jgi:hypothetical protein